MVRMASFVSKLFISPTTNTIQRYTMALYTGRAARRFHPYRNRRREEIMLHDLEVSLF